MDFRDSPEEAAFRAEVRAWLERHAPPYVTRSRSADGGEERLRVAADWQRELFESGYGALGWPEEHGGRPGPAIQRYLVVEEAARLGAPWHLNMAVTLGWCAPALLAFGTEAQQAAHVRAMLSGAPIEQISLRSGSRKSSEAHDRDH